MVIFYRKWKKYNEIQSIKKQKKGKKEKWLFKFKKNDITMSTYIS